MTWQEIKALKEKRAKLVADMKAVTKKGADEKRDLTADEVKLFDELRVKADAAGSELDRAQQLYDLDLQVRNANSPGRDGIDSDRPLADSREIAGFAIKDLRRYSLLRAVNAMAERRNLDGVEGEVSAELATRCGKPAVGFYFPTEFRVGHELDRALESRTGVLNTTTGTGSIPTVIDPSNFIEFLRARVACQAMGARMITGLNGMGTLALPKQTGGATGYWVAESGAPTASNQTVGQVTFTPKTVGAYTDLSRAFIQQTSISAESFVRDDIAKVIAIALDVAAINGSGSSNQPLGLLQNTNINTIATGTNGLAISYANVVAMETNVAQSNVNGSAFGYLTNPKVRGSAKTVLQNTSSAAANWIWTNTDNPSIGQMNGYKAMATTSVPNNLTKGTANAICSALIYGNWDDLIIAMWGQLDILVDPYTGSNSGTVRINALQSADINVRHAESFQIITDILA